MNQPQTQPDSAARDRVQVLLAEVRRRLAAGEPLDPEALLAEHVDVRGRLEPELRKIIAIDRARRAAAQASARAGRVEEGATWATEGTIAAGLPATRASDEPYLPTRASDQTPTPSTDDESESSAEPGAGELGTARDSIPGYRLLRELGRGGQGVVYQAVQLGTKRKVAIKVLLSGAHATAGDRRRFEREVELVARLKHANIVAVYDSGTTADGRQYCAMDYVRGTSLLRYVRERNLTVGQIVRLFAQVCDAVQYAHQHGIIHRDLKPANILVDSDGKPRVMDFGLAKQLSQGDLTQTHSHQIVGTLPYMSPEQTRGNPDEIDTRTDIYALGVVLYELLTGHYPYPVIGSMADVLRNIAEAPPTPPSRVWGPERGVSPQRSSRRRVRCPIDNDLETIVLKALAKERERRYQAAGDMAADLQRYLQGDAILAKRDSTWYVLRKLARRNAGSVAVACSVLAVLCSAGFVSAWFAQREAAALRSLAQSDAVAIQNLQKAQQAIDLKLRFQVRETALAWFLAEFEAGRLERARQVADVTLAASPERAAMEFMLDESRTAEQLLAVLPRDGTALGLLAAGVRATRAGRTDEAIRALEAVQAAPGGEWLRAAARARLAQLAPPRAHAAASQPGGDVP